MAGTRTLTVTPGFEVEREAVTQTSVTDFSNTGVFAVFTRSARPTYKFSFSLPALTVIEAQSLNAFHHFHQGGKAFFWDAGRWGQVNCFSLIAEGDGTQTDFFLPNRFIDSNSLTVAIDDGAVRSTTTAFSLNPDPGVIVFDTAPDSGDDIVASHAHKYKVVFEPSGFTMVQFATAVWKAEVNVREILI